MSIMEEQWLLWQDGAHAPAWNMAADEAMLDAAEQRALPVLRFYGWASPAVTIGYVQKFEAVEYKNVDIVRRPTGGGIVDHSNDFTYSVVVPPSHWLLGVDRIESYGYINRAIGYALSSCGVTPTLAQDGIPRSVDRLRMVCFRQPTRYDILLADGTKVAGSAQRRTRQGLLHQGSILVDSLSASVTRERLSHAVQEGFREVLAAGLVHFEPTDNFLKRVSRKEQEQYLTSDWFQRT